MRVPRGRATRLASIGIVVALVAAAVYGPLAERARAEAPAKWIPLLMATAADVRPGPPPGAGSPEDRAELDQIVALQAAQSVSADLIAFWSEVASPVRWNEILLETVRIDKPNPVRTSRVLALLNVAIHDTVIAACDAKLAHPRSQPADRDSRIRTLAPADTLSSYASVDAAVAAAAVAVLSAVFPGRAATFEAHARDVRQVRLAVGASTASDIAAGTAIGEAVGTRAVVRGAGDGSSAIWGGGVPAGPGAWAPAKPLRNTQPIEPLAGTWQPWLMAHGSEFRPGPPPPFGSPEWLAEADEVIAVTASLTDEQVAIARFWNDGPGTDTPPGHWIRIATELVVRDDLPVAEAARVFAYLGMAQADAFIACWDAKYTYWSGRPTGLLPGFASTIITPHFPAYISGHSTLSGASATVLGAFFPADASTLAEWAEEAAVSRLYGGIHWRSDNEVGLEVGRRIGELAVDRARSDGGLR